MSDLTGFNRARRLQEEKQSQHDTTINPKAQQTLDETKSPKKKDAKK